MKRTWLFLISTIFCISLNAQDLEVSQTADYVINKSWTVVGLIRNNSENAYSDVKLTLTCRNSDDKIVFTNTTRPFSGIPAKDEIPFMFVVSEKNAKDFEKYNVTVDESKIGNFGTFDFMISPLTKKASNEVYETYAGQIINNTNFPRQNVIIAFIGFDKENKLLFYNTTFTDHFTMFKNSRAEFEIDVPTDISKKISNTRCIAFAQ